MSKNVKLFKDTYGAIVDIKGDIPNLLAIMNSPVTFTALESGSTVNTSAKFTAEFTKGKLNFSAAEDTVFTVDLLQKIFIHTDKVEIITEGGKGYINEVIIAFPGLDGLELAKVKLAEMGLELIDLTGTVSQYEGFDNLLEGYQKTKESK